MKQIIHRFFSDISAVVTESTSELMILFVILFLFVLIILMAFYVFHRTRKLNKMDRQIPASLVQSYLNSIIKNSSELKESLFLGGSTPGKENDILALKEELKLKEKMIGELSKLRGGAADAGSSESSITSDSSVLEEELNRVMAERDELMMKVSDYQKAEKDFIDLKKIKEENQELKKQLGITTVEPKIELKTEIKPEPVPQPSEEAKVLEFEKSATQVEEPEKAPEPEKATEPTTEPAKTSEPANLEDVSKEEKSAEDLLKEFEKMLGP